ncbi:hypothetical protein CsSME_00038590 [Camellia sinensis var. sinensis]
MLRWTRALFTMLFLLVDLPGFPRSSSYCRTSSMGRSSARASTLTRLLLTVLLSKLLS